jgi:gamma-glutamyl-gamma-aminobutyrate hydrolase PuuD
MGNLVVGLTTRDCRVHSAQDTVGVMKSYVQAILQFGMVPVLVPHTGSAENYLRLCDAFVIPGGENTILDINETDTASDRDDFEVDVIRSASNQGVPVLGICRGMHLLNVVFGGSVVSISQEHRKSHHPALDNTPVLHHLVLESDVELWGESTLTNIAVTSRHSYTLERIPHRAKVVARSDDGLIEAIRYPDWDALGVQWHCEMLAAPLDVLVWSWLRRAAIRNNLLKGKK